MWSVVWTVNKNSKMIRCKFAILHLIWIRNVSSSSSLCVCVRVFFLIFFLHCTWLGRLFLNNWLAVWISNRVLQMCSYLQSFFRTVFSHSWPTSKNFDFSFFETKFYRFTFFYLLYNNQTNIYNNAAAATTTTVDVTS